MRSSYVECRSQRLTISGLLNITKVSHKIHVNEKSAEVIARAEVIIYNIVLIVHSLSKLLSLVSFNVFKEEDLYFLFFVPFFGADQ